MSSLWDQGEEESSSGSDFHLSSAPQPPSLPQGVSGSLGACYKRSFTQTHWSWSSGGGAGGLEKTHNFNKLSRWLSLLIKFEKNFRCVCLLSHSGPCLKTVVLEPGCLEEPPGKPWKNAVARAAPLVILESLAWDGAQPSLVSPTWSWELRQSFWAPPPGLSPTLPVSQYLLPSTTFQFAASFTCFCTPLIPDRWDSQTTWPMKKEAVKWKAGSHSVFNVCIAYL